MTFFRELFNAIGLIVISLLAFLLVRSAIKGERNNPKGKP